MENIYSKILKSTRIRQSSVLDRVLLTEAESDRGRVLFSPAFRRLQQKAQVFSMEPNAAVRSRLTHSLEVSQIGRYIADQISVQLSKENLATPAQCMALVTFVETACLMHDIGNPPFGHFGEAAIKKWFEDNGAKKIISACNSVGIRLSAENPDLISCLADFLEFDGNPQGLRVVAKLQWNTDEFGLNLSKTTIASYLKYIRMAGKQKPDNKKFPFQKKAGYFTSEKDLVSEIWSEFEYDLPQRFPLAYIMEAADDIAYCISDLEDSIEKELVDKKLALTEIKKNWMAACKENKQECVEIELALDYAIKERDDNDLEYTYTNFRTAINRKIVEFAANRYVTEHVSVFNGTLDSLVPPDSGPGSILKVLKEYCKEKVYCDESVQRTELAGYSAIFGLLNLFGILLECPAERFQCALDYSKDKDASGKPIIIEKKYLKLFPKNYIKSYRNEIKKIDGNQNFKFLEWNERAHLIVDFISGMTDDFAIKTYRNLSGMLL